jgi:hypothetical protein
MNKSAPVLLAAALLAGVLSACFSAQRLVADLPLARPGNWIVVAGPGSPYGDLPNVELVDEGVAHLESLGIVVDAVLATGRVRGVVYLEAELEFLTEDEVPGIAELRNELHAHLKDFPPEDVRQIPRAEILALVEEAAGLRRVALVKTDGPVGAAIIFALDVPARAEPLPRGRGPSPSSEPRR